MLIGSLILLTALIFYNRDSAAVNCLGFAGAAIIVTGKIMSSKDKNSNFFEDIFVGKFRIRKKK